MSGLELVLTLAMDKREGHLPYLSQSGTPANETTVGGRTDDPRRERTRNAPARHRARAGGRQRQRRLSRAGHLPDALLSLAQAAGTVWDRWCPSAPAASAAGASGDHAAGGGAPGARDRHQCGDVGLPSDRGLSGPGLASAPGAQHGAAAAAPGGPAHAPRPADGPIGNLKGVGKVWQTKSVRTPAT